MISASLASCKQRSFSGPAFWAASPSSLVGPKRWGQMPRIELSMAAGDVFQCRAGGVAPGARPNFILSVNALLVLGPPGRDRTEHAPPHQSSPVRPGAGHHIRRLFSCHVTLFRVWLNRPVQCASVTYRCRHGDDVRIRALGCAVAWNAGPAHGGTAA